MAGPSTLGIGHQKTDNSAAPRCHTDSAEVWQRAGIDAEKAKIRPWNGKIRA
eukprot:CAMPEP_0203941938 /NCGR_PEP_ID=MMETSP0359-20131031/78226_1 /ASSEMBLY_ACC=CAM_ASM_000338 /TAXON_ID=268821 /ORGANISM="Scrippsiella Hangoei, Strain SHTV-5" /LENGTH=51 /DNA_ID=CAMNT_0050872577 /DNA_START=161 /DNA_END=316 /DNA_ORIENTATION=-